MYVECLVGSLTVLKGGNDLRACPNFVSNNISVISTVSLRKSITPEIQSQYVSLEEIKQSLKFLSLKLCDSTKALLREFNPAVQRYFCWLQNQTMSILLTRPSPSLVATASQTKRSTSLLQTLLYTSLNMLPRDTCLACKLMLTNWCPPSPISSMSCFHQWDCCPLRSFSQRSCPDFLMISLC